MNVRNETSHYYWKISESSWEVREIDTRFWILRLGDFKLKEETNSLFIPNELWIRFPVSSIWKQLLDFPVFCQHYDLYKYTISHIK